MSQNTVDSGVMTIKATAYVGFRGNAREALTFYQNVFGGEVQIIDWPESDNNLVMHGHLTTTAGWDLMCSDNPELGEEDSAAQRMNMVVWGNDVETMTAQFNALSEGGDVHMPLKEQQWGDMFGGLKDKFGVDWGFNVETNGGSSQ